MAAALSWSMSVLVVSSVARSPARALSRVAARSLPAQSGAERSGAARSGRSGRGRSGRGRSGRWCSRRWCSRHCCGGSRWRCRLNGRRVGRRGTRGRGCRIGRACGRCRVDRWSRWRHRRRDHRRCGGRRRRDGERYRSGVAIGSRRLQGGDRVDRDGSWGPEPSTTMSSASPKAIHAPTRSTARQWANRGTRVERSVSIVIKP